MSKFATVGTIEFAVGRRDQLLRSLVAHKARLLSIDRRQTEGHQHGCRFGTSALALSIVSRDGIGAGVGWAPSNSLRPGLRMKA